MKGKIGRKKINIPLKQCEICNIYIPRNTKQGEKRINIKQYLKARFCSKKCKGVYQTKYIIGENSSNYRGGKSKCIDCNKLLDYRYSFRNLESRCKQCWIKYAVKENHPRWNGKNTKISKNGKSVPSCINCGGATADTYSIMCKNCCKGALHNNWKGGVSRIQSRIRQLSENRQWIKQCMYRDDYTCQECGVKSKNNNLQVHHIKSFALIIKENNIKTQEEAKNCDELWNIDNGITLCRECHKLTFNYKQKIL